MGVLNIGVSSTPVCGVRDAAYVLETAIRGRGGDAATLWCDLANSAGVREQSRTVGEWLAAVQRSLSERRFQTVILHYSVFAFGVRGFPIFAPRVARELDRSDARVIGFFHEFAYPFGLRGWRGAAQAISHRLVLLPVLRSCDAVVVTTEARAEHLRRSRWLPGRPILFIPVFSNLPQVSPTPPPRSDVFSVGVFGFGGPGVDHALVADAAHLLQRRGGPLEVVLIGAPGADGFAAETWRSAFGADVNLLRFTGVLSREDLARAIAAVDVVLFPDRAGPDSRRGTLSAALAAAKSVVAVDGPERWESLVSEGALVVVEASAEALASAVALLRDDAGLRDQQGARAENFYRRRMAAEVALERLSEWMPARTFGRRVLEPTVGTS